MARLRVGQTVKVKANGCVGEIVSTRLLQEGEKRVRILYNVNYRDLDNRLQACEFEKKQIEVIRHKTEEVGNHKKRSVYVCSIEGPGGRTITTVGVVENLRLPITVKDEVILLDGSEGDLIYGSSMKQKMLAVGYSICHPNDENDSEYGAELAMKRSFMKPMTILTSAFSGEFREDFVRLVLEHKAKYIADNIDKFTEKNRR